MSKNFDSPEKEYYFVILGLLSAILMRDCWADLFIVRSARTSKNSRRLAGIRLAAGYPPASRRLAKRLSQFSLFCRWLKLVLTKI